MPEPSTPSLSGRVIRTLEQTPRLAYERFWLDTGSLGWLHGPSPMRKELDIIGEFSVSGPSVGPLLLWDETVGRPHDLDELRRRYMDGNLAAKQPEVPPLEYDVRGLDPLSDAEFWPIIELLGRRMWQKTIDAAAAELARRDEHFVLRWQETCALKALALAAALFEEPWEDYGHEFFLILGAVIGQGRHVYDGVRDRSAEWEKSWLADQSSMVLFLGSLALDRKVTRSTRVTSSFSVVHQAVLDAQHQKNLRARQAFRSRAGAGREEVESWLGPNPGIEDVNRLVRSRGGEMSAEGWDAAKDAVQPPHRRGLPDRLHMKGGRALVVDGGAVKLRVVFTAVENVTLHHALRDITGALESFGGDVASVVDVDEMNYGGPLDAALVSVKRRFRGTRDEYLARFVSGTPLPG